MVIGKYIYRYINTSFTIMSNKTGRRVTTTHRGLNNGGKIKK